MISISQTAKIYAESLINLDISADVVLNDLQYIKDVKDVSVDFQSILNDPSISKEIKIETIEELFKTKVDEKIITFLKLLIEKGRFTELDSIIDAYSQEFDKIKNINRVEVISAIELLDDYKKQITDKLQKRLNKIVIPEWIVDENIIGGLIIRNADNVIDNSLKTKLEKISRI